MAAGPSMRNPAPPAGTASRRSHRDRPRRHEKLARAAATETADRRRHRVSPKCSSARIREQHPCAPVSRWRRAVEQGSERRQKKHRHQRTRQVKHFLRSDQSREAVMAGLPAGPGPLRPPPVGGLPVGG